MERLRKGAKGSKGSKGKLGKLRGRCTCTHRHRQTDRHTHTHTRVDCRTFISAYARMDAEQLTPSHRHTLDVSVILAPVKALSVRQNVVVSSLPSSCGKAVQLHSASIARASQEDVEQEKSTNPSKYSCNKNLRSPPPEKRNLMPQRSLIHACSYTCTCA